MKESQEVSNDIKYKQEVAAQTEMRLQRSREGFRDIASLAGLLFFIVSKLNLVDVMYQYSLSWFINLYTVTIDLNRTKNNTEETEPNEGSPKRTGTGGRSK